MKRNSRTLLLAAAMVLLAGVQTAKAQKVVLHMAGNQTFKYSISQLDSITFEGDDFIIKEDFESYYLDSSGKYYVWDVPSFFTDGTWKSGNPGFKISKSSAQPMDYPSVPVAGGGPDGSDCVKLETCDTGPFGKMSNMRIASGSMFNGSFDVGKALKDPLGATLFGSPFAYKPIQMSVWLRYERGDVYQNKAGETIEDVWDEPDAYVVFYRNEDAEGNKVQLDGNDVLSFYLLFVPYNFPCRVFIIACLFCNYY